jgi:hypothetical protein
MNNTLRSIFQTATFALVSLILSGLAVADPTLSVLDMGLNGNSNREWLVQITPDTNLFSNTVNGTGGSVEFELGFEVSGGDILDAVINTTDFPFENPGNNPFTSSVTFGNQIDLAADTLFTSYGSDFFTTGVAVDVLTIETAGSGLTTLSWGGHTINAGGGYTGSRISQGGINFDGIMGSLTAGDGGLLCDFDDDGLCNISDINLMFQEGPINNGITVTPGTNEQFDLDSDGDIDLDDRDQWLSIAATENGFGSPYKQGDANLDGFVDVSDFNSWNSNKFQTILDWSSGNFNGDSSVDVSDFNAWNSNKFTSADAAVVPEPGTMLLGMMATLAIVFSIRRR